MLDLQSSRRAALRQLAGVAGATAIWPAFAQGPARAPRLVTLGGGVTEIVYALGAQSLLVGTDTTSLYPAAAQRTPKVGYMRQLSAEGLLSLRPDAVVGTSEAGPPVVLEQLRSAGVRLELVEADHSWSEVQRKIRAVGRAAGREAPAATLRATLDAQWTALQQRVAAATARKPRVLFVLSHSGSSQVAGEKTAANAIIGFAGGVNCLAGFTGYRPMTAEAMAAAAPDIILTSTQSIEAHGGEERFLQRPELALTPAFRKRALVTQDALLQIGFGPRMPQAVAELFQRFHAI